MADIIIIDEEFETMSTEIQAQSKTTEETIESLKEAYEIINAEVAKEGVVAENFRMLSEEVSSLAGEFSEIYEEVGKMVKEFIAEIDVADSYFY